MSGVSVVVIEDQQVVAQEPQSTTVVVEDRGFQGGKGDKGDKGDAATVTVAGVDTLPAGSLASISNLGTIHDAQLLFRLPRGDKGEAGDAAFRTEFFTITSTMLADKKVKLAQMPLPPLSRIQCDVLGFPPQMYGFDFYVVDDEVRWDSVALELLLSVGDTLRVIYSI